MADKRTAETAMGMKGYRGSPAEAEDRHEGIKHGGHVRWLALEPGVEDKEENYPVARITGICVDQDGDPWFTLEFIEDDHKPVVVMRSEIIPYKGHLQWSAKSQEGNNA